MRPIEAPEGHESLPEWRGESAVDGFTGREVYDVVGVVDIEVQDRRIPSGILDKVTTDNVDAIIADGVERLRALRERQNEDGLGTTPSEVVDVLGRRAAKSHAIQCSTNRAIDMRAAAEAVTAFAAEQGIPERDQILGFTVRTYERGAAMSATLAELHKIDIKRRLGQEKADPAYFESATADWPGIARRVDADLTRLERELGPLLRGHDGMKADIAAVREFLAEEDPEARAQGFYEELCERLGRIILNDFEELNEPRLITTAKWLASKGARRGDR